LGSELEQKEREVCFTNGDAKMEEAEGGWANERREF